MWSAVFLFSFGTERNGHRLVVGVVVHVAHDDDFAVGIVALQRVLDGANLLAAQFTVERNRSARRKVVDDAVNKFAAHRPRHHQKSASLMLRFSLRINVLHKFVTLILKEARVVEKCAIDTATVGSFLVDNLPSAILQRRLFEKVFKHLAVFDLAHADHGCAPGQTVGAQFGEHFRHVGQLVGVLHRAPDVASVGQVFIVVLVFDLRHDAIDHLHAHVMHCVEEVFEVVEGHGIDTHTRTVLWQCGCEDDDCRDSENCKKRSVFLHDISGD